ncbi:hypothetical protein [Sulfobacillus sp. hq2]|uniref:hypothetical protein n=1 Tax=Sulfobacillus sp. hq2 TaxID=2039167 RepID=UPI0011AED92E|nr:hypothetical protein [Sulfobacillus sp. hq2]
MDEHEQDKKKIADLNRERFQQEVARELGIDLSAADASRRSIPLNDDPATQEEAQDHSPE